MNGSDYVLSGGMLAFPDRITTGLSAVVRGGMLRALVAEGEEPSELPRHDVGGALVTPGLFEFHIHGAGGIGLDDLGGSATTGADRLRRLRSFLRSRGVTGFLPTLVAEPQAVENLACALESAGFPEAEVPGIYLEGPFIEAARRGGIPEGTIRAPDPACLAEILAATRGRLRVMTVAPELPGIGPIIEALREAGVLVSLGHSACDLELVELPAPPFSITHLFNAMSGFSHKEAGLAMLPFLDRRPFVELNADGVHVGASALAASRCALDEDRLILVSDAVVAAGLPPGAYLYHGRRVVAAGRGVRYAEDDVLMGSDRLLPAVLESWVDGVGAGLAPAIRAASLNPRRALAAAAAVPARGMADDRSASEEPGAPQPPGACPLRGALLPGFEADFAVWDRPFSALRELIGTAAD